MNNAKKIIEGGSAMWTTTVAVGSDWGATTLADIAMAYPDADPVAEFHKIARAKGSSARWLPGQSCVTADVDEALDPGTLDEWREQATNIACDY